MGGFMWALRWVAAGTIFATCIAMTVEAHFESISIQQCNAKPLISQSEVRWAQR